eukprot:CAMPEP_0198575734 /NCGR_PEP_ID=MMETSP1462-20131121/116568_1 /TAXON_ID=1333877 /ORGANISM="Brandtodinium nutriculum, Strain RCC3387" /LENGTH=542 /DNA_ID=CAMNT_0044306985 /DNA_START=90 /DNA_END=1718 /DNA_ORIENTATION=-
MDPESRKKLCRGTCGVCGLIVLVTTITLLSGIRHVGEDEQLLVFHRNGRYVEGPGTCWVPPGTAYRHRDVQVLSRTEYVILENRATGEKSLSKGPGRLFLGAWEEAAGKKDAVSIKSDQYLFITDTLTGQVLKVQGPSLVFPETAFHELGDPKEVVRLAEFEAMVTRDLNGILKYHFGQGGGESVSLEPFAEVVSFNWTIGGDVETNHQWATIDRIDTRVRQLPFWFDDIRTSDSMEFELEGIMFWQVVDVERLVQSTADPTSDIWHALRARIAAASSQYGFVDFLKQAPAMKDELVALEKGNNTDFYTSRGVRLHSMELIEVELHSDGVASSITNAIASEAALRINEVEKLRTENELEIARIDGQHRMLMQELANQLLSDARAHEAQTQEAELRYAREASEEGQRAAHELQVAENSATLRITQENHTFALRAVEAANRVALETGRSALLDVLEANLRKESASTGMVTGLHMGKSVDEYLHALQSSLPDLDKRISLFTFMQELGARNATSLNLASGNAQLYVTPESANLYLGPSRALNHTEL